MARPLKIFMRGERVGRLQKLLTRHGCNITDEPGRLGVSTRDAIKMLQSERGLKVNGIADDDFLAAISGGQAVASDQSAAKEAASNDSELQAQFEALSRLLISKGIITEAELQEALNTPLPLRITEAPLT